MGTFIFGKKEVAISANISHIDLNRSPAVPKDLLALWNKICLIRAKVLQLHFGVTGLSQKTCECECILIT